MQIGEQWHSLLVKGNHCCLVHISKGNYCFHSGSLDIGMTKRFTWNSKAEGGRRLTFENVTLLYFLVCGSSIYPFGLGYKSGSHSSVLMHCPHLIRIQILSTLSHHFLTKHCLIFFMVLCSIYQHAVNLIIMVFSPVCLAYYLIFIHFALHIYGTTNPFVWFLVPPSNFTLPFPKYIDHIPDRLNYLQLSEHTMLFNTSDYWTCGSPYSGATI